MAPYIEKSTVSKTIDMEFIQNDQNWKITTPIHRKFTVCVLIGWNTARVSTGLSLIKSTCDCHWLIVALSYFPIFGGLYITCMWNVWGNWGMYQMLNIYDISDMSSPVI